MLHKFDTEQLVKCSKSGFTTALIIGKRNTGKTTFIKDLLNKINPNELTVFASKDLTEYAKYIGDKHTQLDYNILEQIIKNQVMKSDYKVINSPHTIVIDDNSIDYKNEIINQLLYNGRHYHINVIISTSYSNIRPEHRGNMDYVYLLYENSMISKKRLYNHYTGMFPTYEYFDETFKLNVRNYEAMVINNRIYDSDINKMVFRYEIVYDDPKTNPFLYYRNEWYN